MKKITGMIVSTVAFAAISIGTSCFAKTTDATDGSTAQEKTQGGLVTQTANTYHAMNEEMKKKWNDYASYTKDYIKSVVANLDDQETIKKRLLKNQEEIADAIKPYYGKAASKKLSEMLHDNVLFVTDMINATKTNSAEAMKQAKQKWQVNTDKIVTFLNKANPNWSKEDLSKMFNDQLELTTQEATSIFKKGWDASQDLYEKALQHMIMFSDYLSEGIAKQFPDKFNNQTPEEKPVSAK